MKRFAIVFLFSAGLLQARAQQGYWQQQVNHRIQVSLNDQDHSLKGFQTVEYTNNSPQSLDFIWFHLYPNAYKNDQTAYATQVLARKDGKKTLKGLKDRGALDSLDFKVDGVKARTQADPANIDLVKVMLPKPLAPGARAVITTPFYVKIPSYVSRSGRSGDTYMLAQWYPKPAVYDAKGWHQMPYLDQGEFYNEFGNYEVSITVPSKYIVGATGQQQAGDEWVQYKKIGAANVAAGSRKNTVDYQAPATATKTLVFRADSVSDFAWFADKDFIVRYDTLQLGSKVVDVVAFHHPDGNPNWTNSTGYLKTNVRKYSEYLGDYAYPVVQAVEGPKNESSGGMEYPMITLITSPDANSEMLDAVLAHEVGHNWLALMMASNERQYAWLDEGLNTYYQFRYEAEVNKGNTIFGDAIPKEVKELPAKDFQSAIYGALNKIPMPGAIDIPSPDFKDEEIYGLITYLKTAVWMYYLEMNVGKENLDRAMQAYFREWKFKHPQPSDLKAVLERELQRDMTPFFNLLKKEDNF